MGCINKSPESLIIINCYNTCQIRLKLLYFHVRPSQPTFFNFSRVSFFSPYPIMLRFMYICQWMLICESTLGRQQCDKCFNKCEEYCSFSFKVTCTLYWLILHTPFFIIEYTSVCMYLTHFAWILSKLNLIKYMECIILLYCC